MGTTSRRFGDRETVEVRKRAAFCAPPERCDHSSTTDAKNFAARVMDQRRPGVTRLPTELARRFTKGTVGVWHVRILRELGTRRASCRRFDAIGLLGTGSLLAIHQGISEGFNATPKPRPPCSVKSSNCRATAFLIRRSPELQTRRHRRGAPRDRLAWTHGIIVLVPYRQKLGVPARHLVIEFANRASRQMRLGLQAALKARKAPRHCPRSNFVLSAGRLQRRMAAARSSVRATISTRARDHR